MSSDLMKPADDFVHVDDWCVTCPLDPAHTYAAWFFTLHRLPAVLKNRFHDRIEPLLLFCTFEEKRWQVKGASRFGDIWLKELDDKNPLAHYDRRVNIANCSEWAPTVDKNYDWTKHT